MLHQKRQSTKDKADSILLRRQLLDWRDKHVEAIQHHLNRELVLLLQEMDAEIDRMTLLQTFHNSAYVKKRLEPIYSRWLKNEVTFLIESAQFELNVIYEHRLEYERPDNELNHKDDKKNILETTTAVLSTGVAVAAIPTILSLSTTTISAGGVLGLLGVTTTVISWPVALTGGAIVLGLSSFGVSKAARLKFNAEKRFKDKIHQTIRESVLPNEKENSVCQVLQAKIIGVAKTLLDEIKT